MKPHDWEDITEPVDNNKWPTPMPIPKSRCKRCGIINNNIFYYRTEAPREEDDCDVVMTKMVIEG